MSHYMTPEDVAVAVVLVAVAVLGLVGLLKAVVSGRGGR
jgi:VIT1/CCC1 family predicted Fe2+/Mn2+ transporter